MRGSTTVLVIGGGPAGATAAGLLAKEGIDVVVLEREVFPRYHIGESILPSCRPIFEQLGVWDRLTAHGFRPKGGAYFFWGPDEWEVRFSDLGSDGTNAWQVVRSEFDQLLLEHAGRLGAEVVQGVTVRDVEFDGPRPVAVTWSGAGGATGRITFDHLVDASGRAGVLAVRHLANRKFHSVFRNVAAWTYWKDAGTLDRGPDGAIAVCSVEDGWFWAIPLHDGTLSVGLVTSRDEFLARRNADPGGVQGVYEAALQDCPPVRKLLDGATQVGEVKVEQDYSYAAAGFTGPGYFLCGDAACFLDPLLSTGVHLATYSAMLAAAAIVAIERDGIEAERAREFYATVYRRAYERLLVLVSTFYESYRGKEHHFYQAQELSTRDRAELNLQDAFDRIITGIEDIDDAQEAFDRVRHHLRGGQSGDPNPLANLNRVHERKQAPVDPVNAVAGLYLQLTPEFGLREAGGRADHA